MIAAHNTNATIATTFFRLGASTVHTLLIIAGLLPGDAGYASKIQRVCFLTPALRSRLDQLSTGNRATPHQREEEPCGCPFAPTFVRHRKTTPFECRRHGSTDGQ